MISFQSRGRRRCCLGLFAAVAIVVFLNCRSSDLRQSWSGRWGPLVSHKTFPGDCGICHTMQRWDVLREDFSFDHEKQTGYRLSGTHAMAACLRCHNDRGPVRAYTALGCGGCHHDPHASALGADCQSCHGQQNWKPVGPVAKKVRMRFHLIPAHSVPPCQSCHTRTAADLSPPTTVPCEPCHGSVSGEPNSSE